MSDVDQPKEESISSVIAEMNKTPEDVKRAFEELIDSAIPRIPEAVFVQNLLPLSYNDGVEKDPFHWRIAAGSMTNQIHVINPAGEILFTCPGLFPELKMSRDRKERLNWASLLDDVQRHNDRHPGLGEERLTFVGMRHIPGVDEETAKAHLERWKNVWRRYGVNGFAKTDPADLVSKDEPVADAQAEELDEADDA